MHSQYILPQELERPPIEQAMFEIRFQPARDGASARLPLVLGKALGVEYPRSEAVPEVNARDDFRTVARDPRYEAKMRMFGEGADLFIGDGALRVRIGAPYPGWDAQRARIDALLDVLEQSGEARAVERLSLKFVNLLRDVPPRQLEALRVDLRVNGEAAPEIGMHIRMELSDERYVRVVEIQPGAPGPLLATDKNLHGLMLALECRRDILGEEFWPNRGDLLENLHFELRALFFRLLTHEATEKLGPIYRKPPSEA
jgi:uncharacterized protein (TIGR04255 family)